MSLKVTHFLPSHCDNDVSFEARIKDSVRAFCSDAKPSEKVRIAILQYEASYECLDTKIGNVDVILN